MKIFRKGINKYSHNDLISRIKESRASRRKVGSAINEDIDDSTSPEATSAPTTAEGIGVAQILSDLIKDEWEAIDGYNSAIVTLSSMDDKYDDIIAVLEDIVNEENIHIGQLEAALKTIAPDANSIDKGVAEGEEQINDSSDTDEVLAV